MPPGNTDRLPRRTFLRRALSSATLAGLSVWPARGHAAKKNSLPLQAGEGEVDITPPLGITMGGFHRPPDNPRRITGVRQSSAARALLLATVAVSLCTRPSAANHLNDVFEPPTT